MLKQLIFLTSVVAVIACSDPTAPRTPAVFDAVPAVDTHSLRETWEYMQRCSGLSHTALHLQDLVFYSVPRDVFTYRDTTPIDGLFIANWRQIYIAQYNVLPSASEHTFRIVRHEMMHALLWPMPSNDHPAEWFLDGPCGNLMNNFRF